MTEEQNLDPSADAVEPQEEAQSSEEAVAAEATPEEQPVDNEPSADISGGAEDNAAESEAFPEDSAGDDSDKVVNDGDVPEDEAEAAMLSMLEGLPEEEQNVTPEDINFGSTSVSKAEFQHLSEPAGNNDPRNIDLLMDVDLPISIELGRTHMSIADILALGPGSVVELNKLAGEPVDLLVNQKVVAKGEVVVVDENFGLRITQLLTQEERLKSLGKE
ncbi:MAG: flagellar motor switch protein FliN [candidate division Zixibacteria bacterium]|nr:flagellar motor switch protein FliN [candidate division Zixibacteria bacterium]